MTKTKLPKNADVSFPRERIEHRILMIRGHKVLLDADLAELYGVETRILIHGVKRNEERFPADFMFQLNQGEFAQWRSQIVISNPGAKMGLRRPPYAFTEQGVAMLSSVLHSERAVATNIQIMRAFVKLRRVLGSNKELACKLDELEDRYDEQFAVVFDAIRKLMEPPQPRKK